MNVSCVWQTVTAVADSSGLNAAIFLAHQATAGTTYMRVCGADVLINETLSDAIIAANA